MCVFMCNCMCTFVLTFVCTCVCMCATVWMCVCLYVNVPVLVYTCEYVCVCVPSRVFVCNSLKCAPCSHRVSAFSQNHDNMGKAILSPQPTGSNKIQPNKFMSDQRPRVHDLLFVPWTLNNDWHGLAVNTNAHFRKCKDRFQKLLILFFFALWMSLHKLGSLFPLLWTN